MKRAKQENSILNLLERRGEFVTANEIAEELLISTKTVYRIIQGINANSEAGNLIISEARKGYKLNYEQYLQQSKSLNDKTNRYSPSERRNVIKEKLLLNSPKPLNIYDLFEDYYVSESVINTDQQIMAADFKLYDLELVRKNRELSIVGHESNIRKAIFALIKGLDIIDLEELKEQSFSALNMHDALFILGQLRELEKDLQITIPYPYNINIFSHLYILMNRSRKVNLKELALGDEERRDFTKNQALFNAAKEIIGKIESYLGQTLPHSEIIYLYQYLQSTRFQGTVILPVNFSDETLAVTRKYLEAIGSSLGLAINDEANLVELANHIKPMLNRLQNNIPVKNGLLDEISTTYRKIFDEVSKVSKEISEAYGYPTIDDNENGFITLYFAKMLETQNISKKVLIVCTTGVGTSELLRAKVMKKFPHLQIVNIIATRDLTKQLAMNTDVDLVITTVNFSEPLTKPTVLVSAMFNENDQKKLQEKLGETI